jgi:predicted nucleic acid-binding protein
MAGIILDSSVAAAWVLDDEQSELVDAAVKAAFEGSGHAPTIRIYEIQNMLTLARRRKRIALDAAQEACELLASIPLRFHPPQGLGREFALATSSGLTAYDAAYLCVARDLQMPLATLDTPLRDAAHSIGIALFEPR